MLKERGDLFFGLVGGLGTDLKSISKHTSDLLRSFDYAPYEITLSSLLDHVKLENKKTEQSDYKSQQAKRLDKYMSKGDTLRERASKKSRNKELGCSAVALLGIQKIRTLRNSSDTNPNAFIIKSLKHPSEIDLLRSVYRDSFFCISIFSSQNVKIENLEKLRLISLDEAKKLIKRDEDDDTNDYGQKTRKTFEMGDLFISQDDCTHQNQLDRFLKLIFGAPDVTPNSDEHAMYLAYSASLRSGDLSRHVGSSIISRNLDLLAVGANDVPKSGGGQYWPGVMDKRDIIKKYDSNESQRVKIAEEIFNSISSVLYKSATKEKFLTMIEDTALFDITEYGRAVHAEMEAIISCARTGVSTVGATLFCTTFPCHNCAKHIVDAGIERVVFVEAYPKSRATDLHGDSIKYSSERQPIKDESPNRKVCFEPFVGIGPRRYIDFFSMKLSSGPSIRKKKNGLLVPWDKACGVPRVPSSKNSIDLEHDFLLKTTAWIKR